MSDYGSGKIDPLEHWDDECAFCGAKEDLTQMVVLDANSGGTVSISGCGSCRLSMGSRTPEQWLMGLPDQDQAKWQDIYEWQKWKQTSLSGLVRQASKESA